MRGRVVFARVALAGALLLTAGTAMAQTAQGVPNALQGFSQNRDQPVRIEATTLEVRDKEKVATFSGNVQLSQGDTILKCRTLVVYYEGEGGASTMSSATPGPGGQNQIRRLEAKGGVVVVQKEQTATGDTGIFDMKTNTVTLAGNVVVTQGQNVLRGERLMVDLGTGVSRVEAGKSGKNRVEGVFSSGGRNETKPDAPAAAPQRPAPGAPLRLN